MIKDFTASLDNTQDTAHREAIFSSMQEFGKQDSHNLTYISDKQLHPIELGCYNDIEVPVDG